MKKLLTLTILTIAIFGTTLQVSARFAADDNASATAVGGSFKILNDTGADIQIHTGSGFVEINKGSSTSVSCDAGKVISLAEKGKKKGELFTVDESMCGKMVKLSKYL
jgi:hypothetical protein